MTGEVIQHLIDSKTKPIGALGQLETLAFQICSVQNTLEPKLIKPNLLVFAADHGIADEGISAYPATVTPQMVYNFLKGTAAINVFCRQHGMALKIVDAGVNHEFMSDPNLINAKIAKGTNNFLKGKAMTAEEVDRCFEKAGSIVNDIADTGCNIIGFGEMGIGNTSSASMLMSALCNLPIEDCIGRGTGLNEDEVSHKIRILRQAQQYHPEPNDALTALQYFGGFEIAQMCGAMLGAYQRNMLILIDGFIATVAYLCAQQIKAGILRNAIFCHQSDEKGHLTLLNHLKVKPLLQLSLRLGEGTGCVLAFPIIQSAVLFINEMASFETAGVDSKKV